MVIAAKTAAVTGADVTVFMMQAKI